MSRSASNRAQALPQAASYPTVERTANWLIATLGQRDVLVVLCFCAIGLIVSFAALAQLPDFASALEEVGTLP